ncbi:MAG: hypothetical protein AAF587_11475 [Bacteroidota bacterium]
MSSVFRFFSLSAFVLLIGLTSCQQGEDDPTMAEVDAELVVLEADIEATYEEVDAYSFEAMDLTDLSAEARRFVNPSDQMISSCVIVTHDSVNKVVTVDFGTGCIGADGKERKGQIIITYTQRLYRPGAQLSIALQNYSVDGVQVEGTKTITNVSPTFQANISLNTTLVGGKITWLNGDVATRQFTRTRTWVRAANPILDEFHVEGAVQGSRRNGNAYQINIVSTLIYKRSCRLQGVRIPVQGLKAIQRSNRPNVLVDVGDGDCDHLITITVNGSSHVVDVRDL